MKNAFTISAQSYDSWFATSHGKKVLEEEKKLFHRLMWKEKGSLLDIGCGTGVFTTFFRELGFSVVGVDLSLEMLIYLRAKDPKIPLVLGDAQLLPFGRDLFHYATLITVLEFLSHPFFALVEAIRIAAKGVAVAFLPPWAPMNVKRRLKSFWGRSVFKKCRFLSFTSVFTALEEACAINGRKVIRMEKGGCLYPLGIRSSFLAGFALVRVDYE